MDLRVIYYFRFYSKFDKKREKQKRQDDEESVEDVDDDEFERALGKVVFFLAVTFPVFPSFADYYFVHCILYKRDRYRTMEVEESWLSRSHSILLQPAVHTVPPISKRGLALCSPVVLSLFESLEIV